MHIVLRRLSVEDDRDVYDMLQEIPRDENGYLNGCNGRSFEEYKDWLIKSDGLAKGENVPEGLVPQTVYWLFADGVPVGMGKLRSRLTEALRETGGHVGYAIRPSKRGKGYGKLLLRLLIVEAQGIGVDRMLITIQNHNTPSIRTALSNGGVVERTDDVRHYIWVACDKTPGGFTAT